MAMRHTIKYNGVECQVCVCVLFPRTQRNERTEDHYQECGGWAGSLNCLPKKKKIEHGTHWVGCNIIYIHIAWCEHLAAHLNTKPHTQSLSWMECARTRTAQAQLHVIFFNVIWIAQYRMTHLCVRCDVEENDRGRANLYILRKGMQTTSIVHTMCTQYPRCDWKKSVIFMPNA